MVGRLVAGIDVESIARRCTKLDEGGAFVAGLIHRIGILYTFTKHNDYPDLLQDPESRENLSIEWAARSRKSIVANWDLSKEMQGSINPDEVELVVAASPESCRYCDDGEDFPSR